MRIGLIGAGAAAHLHAEAAPLVVGHVQHFRPTWWLPERTGQWELGQPVLAHDYRSTDYRPGARSPRFLSREIAGGGCASSDADAPVTLPRVVSRQREHCSCFRRAHRLP